MERTLSKLAEIDPWRRSEREREVHVSKEGRKEEKKEGRKEAKNPFLL